MNQIQGYSSEALYMVCPGNHEEGNNLHNTYIVLICLIIHH